MKNVFFYKLGDLAKDLHGSELADISISIISEGKEITGLYFGRREPQGAEVAEAPLIRDAARQLRLYLAGKLRAFDLPLGPRGTDFQKAAWRALLEIPYGETRSYGEIAGDIGRPKAARAVGLANNRNPISIIVPCHRVIGGSGALVGYAAGLSLKRYLLDLERSVLEEG